MNFVFINPPYEVKRNNIWSIINSEIPPLGLALLAAIWDEQGHTSQIIDAAVLKLSIPDIINSISPNADFVGITATTPMIYDAITIAKKVRKRFPYIKVIMGGPHATIFHKELVQDNICDMVIRNEGEVPITELAKGISYNLIPNLTWENSLNEIIVNADSSSYVDLDSLPFPAYDKLPMKLYHSALGAAKYTPSIGMVTSRGCPGKCTFCFSKMFGTQIRFMSPARIIEQIEFIQKAYGIKEISFYDDNFTTNKNNVFELCDLIIKKKIKISWSCFTRVDSVSPGLLISMKKAGCHQIMYGFETTDERTLEHMNKAMDLNQFHQTISWTKAAKINIRGAFMIGNPGETEISMKKTIEFAKNSGLQLAVFNITTPYPGTEIYKEFLKNNSLIHQNWPLYDRAHPILKLDTVSEDIVKKYYYKSYRDFYLRPAYILKRIFTMRTFSEFKIYFRAFMKIAVLISENIFSKRSANKSIEVDLQ